MICFFEFSDVFFLLPVFLCFCFVKRPQKAIFLQCERFLAILFPQKACFKMLLFFIFCFLCFPFVFSFKIHFFLCFLSINPFLEKVLCGGFFCLFFVFSFLDVCFSLWNKLPNIPFLKPKLLLFLAFFLLLFLFLFSWCMFLPFCFDVAFVFLLCFYFVLICFCSCFAIRQWKTSFSLQF